MGNDGLQQVKITYRFGRAKPRAWGDFLDLCQFQDFHDAYVHPADVEFIPFVGQLGRTAKGVVVVVQFFAANQNAPGYDVGAGIFAGKIAVSPVVANAIDDAGGRDRNPCHLYCPDGQPDGAEQHQIDNHHQINAKTVVFVVHVVFQPVVGCAGTEFFDACFIFAGGTVKFGAFKKHFFDTQNLRAVRIFRRFATGVVLAMDCRPLTGDHAGGQPEPETEKMTGNGM